MPASALQLPGSSALEGLPAVLDLVGASVKKAEHDQAMIRVRQAEADLDEGLAIIALLMAA